MKKKKNDSEGILENLYLKIISEAIGFTKKDSYYIWEK